MITALLGLSAFVASPGHALSWGVAIAGAAQFVWLMVACHEPNFSFVLRPRMTPRVKRLLVLILPGAIGAGVVQVNLLIDVVVASAAARFRIVSLLSDRVNSCRSA